MVRSRYGIILLAVFALILVACGEEEAEPTAEPTSAAVNTVEDEDSAIDEIVDEDSTPTVSGTPDVAATPEAITAASPAVIALASPAAATPEPSVGAVPADISATPASGSLIAATLSGSVVLPGMANQAYVISEDGCVGIGSFAGLEAGQQVVIRDAAGAIIGVTELGASDATDSCQWVFQLEVPESTFYSVELPMIAQHVYTQEEVASANGEIELTLD
ncbi:MAG: hypothetical protein M3451_00400 [Chloroflexota bacterium]|jgi:hypothetical protein|nr:hypothetical protein [Chloroflexota bacterium]